MGFFHQTAMLGRREEGPQLPQCGKCGLRRQCHSPAMPVTGTGRRKILFIGEAPGEQEDRRGEQFIGETGQQLRSMLRDLDVDLDDCWKHNAASCRPPKNVMDDLYIESCRPLVMKTIRELRPNVIVLLGASPVKSVIGAEWKRDIGTIGRWVGWTIPSEKYRAWLCPTYHPSYVKRMKEDPALLRITKQHLARAIGLEHEPPPLLTAKQLQERVECVLDRGDALRRLEWLAQQSGVLVFDYETTGLKPEAAGHRIVSCSFCLDGKQPWACMIDEGMHYALSCVLEREQLLKVASNLKFEDRWTRAKLGHPVRGWHWDTVLGAHVLDNRPDICSVKFQLYVHYGVPDYEAVVASLLRARYSNDCNRIDEIAPLDLLLYNGVDAVAEWLVYQKQVEVLCHGN